MFLLRSTAPLLKVTRGHIKRLNPSVRQTASNGSTYVTGKFILSRAYTAATTTTNHDDTEVCIIKIDKNDN